MFTKEIVLKPYEYHIEVGGVVESATGMLLNVIVYQDRLNGKWMYHSYSVRPMPSEGCFESFTGCVREMQKALEWETGNRVELS